MEVSLDEAIAIHAHSLKYRRGAKGGHQAAVEKANRCAENGDHEGAEVWSRVAVHISSMGRRDGGQLRGERMAVLYG